MKTVIIDNDHTAINNLEDTLEDIGLTTIIGKYTCAEKAEPDILKLRPELIILETDLEKVNGLRLAKKIEEDINDIKFIFITSDSYYAVEAFELSQVDFILKPFEPRRVTRALKKLEAKSFNLNRDVTHLICCFKSLRYIELEQDDSFNQIEITWRTKYAKEIFAYLITHQNINVRKDVLIEMFWPGVSLKDAYRNLYTNIYFIRTTLKKAALPIQINNCDEYYKLDLKNIKLDFNFWLEQIEINKDTNLSKLERIMDLYRGHFLQEESYLWAEYKTQKYRSIWLETMEYIIEQHIKRKNIHRAVINTLYLQNIEPYLEKTYYILMDLFAQIKDYSSVEKEYKKLERILFEEYDAEPEKSLYFYLNQ